jgi:hypothetical protein
MSFDLSNLLNEDIRVIFSPDGSLYDILSTAMSLSNNNSKLRQYLETLALKSLSGELHIIHNFVNFEQGKFGIISYLDSFGVPVPPSWIVNGENITFHGFPEVAPGHIDEIVNILGTENFFSQRYFYDNSLNRVWLLKPYRDHNPGKIQIILPKFNSLFQSRDYWFQELELPPRGDRFVRDIRVLTVDNLIADCYSVRAPQPICDYQGQLLNVPPTQPQVQTKLSNLTLDTEVSSMIIQQCKDLGQQVFNILYEPIKKDDLASILLNPHLFTLGIDFVISNEGPKVIEIHTIPQEFNNYRYMASLAQGLDRLSNDGKISIVGSRSYARAFLQLLPQEKLVIY